MTARRVYARNACNALRRQVFVHRHGRQVVAGVQAVLSHRKSGHADGPRLHVLAVHAVVTDDGIGGNDNLACVGRIGQNLLVARHAGVENHLAERVHLSAEGFPLVPGAVLQRQDRPP